MSQRTLVEIAFWWAMIVMPLAIYFSNGRINALLKETVLNATFWQKVFPGGAELRKNPTAFQAYKRLMLVALLPCLVFILLLVTASQLPNS